MQCLYPDCPNSRRTRGLCHGHYQVMRQRVREAVAARQGTVLEIDLVKRGLLLPAGAPDGGSPAPDHLGAFLPGSTVRGRAHGEYQECTCLGSQGGPDFCLVHAA